MKRGNSICGDGERKEEKKKEKRNEIKRLKLKII